MIVLGIDPSLTGCGIVVINNDRKVLLSSVFGYSLKIRSESQKILRNLKIAQEIVKIGKSNSVDFVGVEGLGMSPKGSRIGNQIFLAELLGVIKSQIFLSLQKEPIMVPPPSWKKLVIGNGRAQKPDVKKYFVSEGYNLGGQDEYDALGVALFILDKKKHLISRFCNARS